MAYQYIEEDNLSEALHESETYTEGYYADIPELQRISYGKPGKVPKGKPNVTDGTVSGMRREMPKEIIQQIPTGSVIMKKAPDFQQLASGILTDDILPYANSGGTPFAKAKRALTQTWYVGSAWAVCFWDRTGDKFHANYKLKHYRDILFAPGKISEFDMPFIPEIDWFTEWDIKSILWDCTHLENNAKGRGQKYSGSWRPAALQELLSNGASDKPTENMSEAEKKAAGQSAGGFFKLVKFHQIGVKATIYTYAPAIKKVVRVEVSKDPRGIMPVHGLVLEEDDETPLGEPLAAQSAPKQNLLDYDMQMYQYGQGLGYSPTLKKWGETPLSRIKIAPDHVIKMKGTKQDGDDVEVMDTGNSSTSNFSNNYGLIKSQILNETGRTGDTSVSGESGNPGFSKTENGVKAGQARLGTSNNDYRKTYELWQARIYETLLNIQFAEAKGIKPVELEDDTMKRMGLSETPQIDYDQDYGKIRFHVDASTSQEQDNDSETEKLAGLQETRNKYGAKPDAKAMLMYNQIVDNAGVGDGDKLKYTDKEIEIAQQINDMELKIALKQASDILNPPAPQPQSGAGGPAVEGEVMPNEDEQQAAAALKQRGFSDQQIAQGLDLLRQGADDEQVMQTLMAEGQPNA